MEWAVKGCEKIQMSRTLFGEWGLFEILLWAFQTSWRAKIWWKGSHTRWLLFVIDFQRNGRDSGPLLIFFLYVITYDNCCLTSQIFSPFLTNHLQTTHSHVIAYMYNRYYSYDSKRYWTVKNLSLPSYFLITCSVACRFWNNSRASLSFSKLSSDPSRIFPKLPSYQISSSPDRWLFFYWAYIVLCPIKSSVHLKIPLQRQFLVKLLHIWQGYSLAYHIQNDPTFIQFHRSHQFLHYFRS